MGETKDAEWTELPCTLYSAYARASVLRSYLVLEEQTYLNSKLSIWQT